MSASLASATNTRVDSASKHILQCKVHTDYMAAMMHGTVDNAMHELQQNKHKYTCAQNDLVVGLGRPLYGTSMNNTRNKAYPPIISTLGQMDPVVRRWMAMSNFTVQDYTQINSFKNRFLAELKDPKANMDMTSAKKEYIQTLINNLLEMYPMGISLGLGYSHPHDGDTVVSIMLGGLRTITNGHFQVHTGDMLMFYFDDEIGLFEENGGRKNRSDFTGTDGSLNFTTVMTFVGADRLPAPALPGTSDRMDRNTTNRFNYHEKENANFVKGPHGGRIDGKLNIFRVKPYIVSRYPDTFSGNSGAISPQHFPNDKARVFAKAISNARPFDFLDIQLSRQSI